MSSPRLPPRPQRNHFPTGNPYGLTIRYAVPVAAGAPAEISRTPVGRFGTEISNFLTALLRGSRRGHPEPLSDTISEGSGRRKLRAAATIAPGKL